MSIKQIIISPWKRFLRITGLNEVYQIWVQLSEEAQAVRK